LLNKDSRIVGFKGSSAYFAPTLPLFDKGRLGLPAATAVQAGEILGILYFHISL